MCHATTCSNCRFFQPEGHYHGSCARLQSMVMGEWPACRLGRSAFGLGEESIERKDSASRDLLEQLPPKILVEARDLMVC
jgi:hypothetical protein